MEQMPMFTPESPGGHDDSSGGHVSWLDDHDFDKLFPKTTIDHLLSEDDRRKAAEERREFEAVGRTMFLTERSLYPVFYESARERIASGASPNDIRDELLMLAADADLEFASVIRVAYEDVLAGRPPRFTSQL
jgi:hypothetical protein